MIKPPIIVTGCQRSGTGIVTEILAKKYEVTRLGIRDLWPSELPKLRTLLANNIDKFALQMPIALNCWLDMWHTYPQVHFVGVMRDTEDIVASMKRIEWRKDDFYHWPDYLYDSVAYQKGQWGVLKDILPDTSWTEVEYESFKDHPLFVEKEKRKDFTVNQVEVGKPVGPVSWRKNDIILSGHTIENDSH